MPAVPAPPAAPTPREPWRRGRPGLVWAAAGVLFAAVFALRLSGTPAEAYAMLYTLPVALVATTFGRRAGTGAGLFAVVLVVLWVVVKDLSLSPAAWTSRVVPLLLLGVLLGHAKDRARRAELERRRVEAAVLLHREAIEINDSMLQGMAAAKWSLDSGQVDTGKQMLDQTMLRARDLVAELIQRAGMAARTEPLQAQVQSARGPHSSGWERRKTERRRAIPPQANVPAQRLYISEWERRKTERRRAIPPQANVPARRP